MAEQLAASIIEQKTQSDSNCVSNVKIKTYLLLLLSLQKYWFKWHSAKTCCWGTLQNVLPV